MMIFLSFSLDGPHVLHSHKVINQECPLADIETGQGICFHICLFEETFEVTLLFGKRLLYSNPKTWG